ncbi:non-canonical purine NTP pyrophosphatase [Fructobacillus sp. W13]|uniref:Non-canonical purine NTP pyrophosphatase n=1 Tax=Fructobacillus apis TaxID=2935017 RepID=A0ABT0ZNK2_9LACO|nr:non-canonical purine NTP pyrophosphatase [Fructobacillus apis]MCO0831577.1 non-canonical purine NTP pyrophosphatase [Fructobacillus apis]
MRFVFATNNQKKIMELKKFGALLDQEVVGYEEVLGKRLAFPAESEDSLEDNAKAKANFVHQYLPDEWVLADDTGFFLEAFPDRFGVTAAREMKELGLSGSENINRYLLDLYKDVPDEKRGAYFLATMALVSPEGKVVVVAERGGVAIAHEPHGGPELGGITDIILGENGQTLSAMPLEEVLDYHDRSRALRALIEAVSKQ